MAEEGKPTIPSAAAVDTIDVLAIAQILIERIKGTET